MVAWFRNKIKLSKWCVLVVNTHRYSDILFIWSLCTIFIHVYYLTNFPIILFVYLNTWTHESEQVMLNVRKTETELNEQIDYLLLFPCPSSFSVSFTTALGQSCGWLASWWQKQKPKAGLPVESWGRLQVLL